MVDRQPYTFDRVIRILFGVVSVVGLFYLVYILRGALLPFLVAWIVAYMLNPLVVYNKRVFKLKGRVVAGFSGSVDNHIFVVCVVSAVDYR